MGNSEHVAKVRLLGEATRRMIPSSKDSRDMFLIGILSGPPDLGEKLRRTWVDLSRSLKADGQIDLSGEDLSSLAFWGSIPLFSGANLNGTNFANSFFFQFDFEQADLKDACFDQCVFPVPVCFRGSCLEKATFKRVVNFVPFLEKTNLRNACFDGVIFRGGPYIDDGTDLTNASFVGCECKLYSDGSGGDGIKKFLSFLSREQKKQIMVTRSS